MPSHKDKDDLTKVTDLGDFIHEDEEHVEDYFSKKENNTKIEEKIEEVFPIESPLEDAETPLQEESFDFESSFEEEPFSEETHFTSDTFSENNLSEEDFNTKEEVPQFVAEIKKEIESIKFDSSVMEPNPPYSLLIENISSPFEVNEVLKILREYNLFQIEDESETVSRLERGKYLISRVSEYLLIHLISKLNKINVSLHAGPSELIFQAQEDYPFDLGTPYNQHNLNDLKEEINTQTQNHILICPDNSPPGFTIKKFIQHIQFSGTNDIPYIKHLETFKKIAIDLNANAIINFKYQLINNNEYLFSGDSVWIIKN